MRKSKVFLPLLLLVLLAAGFPSVHAESTNARPCDNGAAPPTDPYAPGFDERLLGVCHLEGTDNGIALKKLPGNTYDGFINFSIRSCSPGWNSDTCATAVPYAVRIDGDATNNNRFFLLTNSADSNDTIRIKLAFISGAGEEQIRNGDLTSAVFNGGANGQQVPAQIAVSINNSNPRATGVYSGTFTLQVDQCGTGDFSGSAPCNGSLPLTRIQSDPITFTISIVIEPQIEMHYLDDIALEEDGSGGYGNTEDFCVSTTASTLFRVTAASDNGTGAFVLTDAAAADSLNYQVNVQDIDSGLSETLAENTLSALTWRGHAEQTCNSGAENNMRLRVTVPAAEIQTAVGASYQDVLTITVQVE